MSNVAFTVTNDTEMVKMVDVRYDGNSFAFPGGELLIEQGNTGKDIMGVWEKIPLEDITYAFKSRMTGFFIFAGPDGYLLAPPAEPPTVFAVEEAEDGTFIEPDSGLVWDVVYTEGSNVGRVMINADQGQAGQR
ncbi:hypothetical protein B0H13DRAFT_2313009 [Mycena leptocephala]|nr:hypothetical protein B0H13DRAFT_2313009 [Mycena leptocephala]